MNPRVIRTLLLATFLLGIHPAWTAVPTATTSDLPDFKASAVTAAGKRTLRKSDLLGHVWIADFIYTSCGAYCPLMTHQLAELQSRLPADVYLVSFTIDPKNDTLPVLQAYARENKADPARWYFVRMGKRALTALMQGGFRVFTIAKVTPKEGSPWHNAQFVIVDTRGRVRAYYDSLDGKTTEYVPEAVDVLRREK